MKEPDCTMMIMSSHGTLERLEGKETQRSYKGGKETKTFRYGVISTAKEGCGDA